MSPLVFHRPLPAALDALVCSLIGEQRAGIISEAALAQIVERLHQAAWYAKVTGAPDAAIAELDLAVATERLAAVLAPQNPTVPA